MIREHGDTLFHREYSLSETEKLSEIRSIPCETSTAAIGDGSIMRHI